MIGRFCQSSFFRGNDVDFALNVTKEQVASKCFLKDGQEIGQVAVKKK